MSSSNTRVTITVRKPESSVALEISGAYGRDGVAVVIEHPDQLVGGDRCIERGFSIEGGAGAPRPGPTNEAC